MTLLNKTLYYKLFIISTPHKHNDSNASIQLTKQAPATLNRWHESLVLKPQPQRLNRHVY